MLSPKSIRLPIAVLVLGAALAVFVAACDGSGSGYRSPTAPPAPVPPASATSSATFVGEMTVVSVAGQGTCSFGHQPGDTVGGALWGLTYTADSFALDFELGNHWYNGTLRGRSFAAEYIPSAAHTHPCDYRVSISGTFADDFSSFEANEIYTLGIAGPLENQVRVEVHWRGVGAPHSN